MFATWPDSMTKFFICLSYHAVFSMHCDKHTKEVNRKVLLPISGTSQPVANCSNHQLLPNWYSGPVTISPVSDAGYNLPFSHHSGACFSSHYSKLSRQKESWLMNTNITLSYWPVCVPVTQEEKTPYPPAIYSPSHVFFLKAFQGKTSNLLPFLSLQPDKSW